MTNQLDFDAFAVATAIADAARVHTLSGFRTEIAVDNKWATGFDPVTEADRAAEKAMRQTLAERRPDDGIFGEEFGHHTGTTGWTWYLDPIDGTRAYIAGLPVWTTLIGLVDGDGNAVVGLIDQPVLDERYLGGPNGTELQRGGDTRRLSVSACDDLRRSIISTTDAFILSPSEQAAWTHLRHTARLARYGLDGYAYARLAAGTIDLVAESGLAPYDAAALIPIVRGAGGVACDWRGNPARPGGQLVCAASQPLLEQALVSLRRSAS